MSEEEPEPLSRGLKEFINISIVRAGRMDDYRLLAHYHTLQQEYEQAQEERREAREVASLSVHADAFFRLYEPSGDRFDQTITNGEATLRRRQAISERDGRIDIKIQYFFNDQRNDKNYCRTWTNASERINWCPDEKRHEPATGVREHLDDAFPPVTMRMRLEPKRFGKVVVPRVLRQKA